MTPSVSLIIPANNEAAWMGRCLDAVLASEPLPEDAPVQVIVVANGCTDATAEIAADYAPQALARGWAMEVLDLPDGGKLGALAAGEAAAQAPCLAYLDADVTVDPALLKQVHALLKSDAPRYASGAVRLAHVASAVTRAYGRFYRHVPFMQQTAPGCGFFALNAPGRAVWGEWPDIISDDTFARLAVAPEHRREAEAGYDWPLVEGLSNLIKVRRRQNAGVDEIADRFPDLLNNDVKGGFTPGSLLKAVLRAPLGFCVYATVALCVKLTPGSAQDWRRGR